MKPIESIKADAIRFIIDARTVEIGQYDAVSYAQRVVSRRETGALSYLDVELINGCNEEHFLMCYNNLCQSHLARLGKAPEVTTANAATETGL